MSPAKRRFVAILILALLFAAACNRPGSVATPTLSGVDSINTAAALTVVARLTQVGGDPATPVGETPLSLTPSAPTQTTGTPPAAGATVTPAPSGEACDRVRFLQDVTYPDDTPVAPGQTFIKTWRLENAGTCTWTTGYDLVFTGGEQMGAPASVPLETSVAPGATVDVSVPLTAPQAAGTHTGTWKLRNEEDQVFGIGPENEPFFVQIVVREGGGGDEGGSGRPDSGLVFDFLVKAPAAAWFSRSSGGEPASLAFDGAESDPNGTVKFISGIPLETGADSGKLLLMIPRNEGGGLVYGFFEPFTVRSGDTFRARIGFVIPSGACKGGPYLFQLVYREGDDIGELGEWREACDGRLSPVEVDLSPLRGRTVELGLVVRAVDSFSGDWPIWSSPRIER